MALASDEEALACHDAAPSASLGGQKGDADDLGVHGGGGACGASGDNRTPGCGELSLRRGWGAAGGGTLGRGALVEEWGAGEVEREEGEFWTHGSCLGGGGRLEWGAVRFACLLQGQDEGDGIDGREEGEKGAVARDRRGCLKEECNCICRMGKMGCRRAVGEEM